MVMFGRPNRIDQMTLSGGGYSVNSPLSYATTRQLDQRAVTASALRRDTWFYATATMPVALAAAALCGHNLTTSALVRWRGFSADPRGAIDGLFTAGVLPTGFAITRGSNGTYFDRSGVLQTAANDTARFEFSNGVCEGLLLEAQTTNGFLWCRDGSNAAWTKNAAMSATKTATGIDGAANSATKLMATSSTARISQAGTGAIESVYLRRPTGGGTGAIKITADNFGTLTTIVLTSTWQRFSIARVSTFGIQIDTSGDFVEMDFAQDEAGTIPSSPVLTTSSTANRSADTLTFAGAAVAGVNFTSGALMVYAKLIRRAASGTPVLVSIASTNGGADYVRLNHDSTGVQSVDIAATTSQVTGLTSSAIANGSTFATSLSWAANSVRASFDGNTSILDSSANMPAGTPVSVVMGGSSNLGNYYVRRLKVYPSAKTAAQLESLSSADLELTADYDSGWFAAWHADYLATADADMISVDRTPCFLKPNSATATYLYWRFDASDESNPAGFHEYGRPVLCSTAFQPRINASYGSVQLNFIDLTQYVRAYSGARYFEENRNPRRFAFNLDALSNTEAFEQIYPLLSQQGTTKEVLFSLDPTDGRNLPRHTFLCTMSKMDPITAVGYGLNSTAVEIEELL